jgi:hypothetical protein
VPVHGVFDQSFGAKENGCFLALARTRSAEAERESAADIANRSLHEPPVRTGQSDEIILTLSIYHTAFFNVYQCFVLAVG